MPSFRSKRALAFLVWVAVVLMAAYITGMEALNMAIGQVAVGGLGLAILVAASIALITGLVRIIMLLRLPGL